MGLLVIKPTFTKEFKNLIAKSDIPEKYKEILNRGIVKKVLVSPKKCEVKVHMDVDGDIDKAALDDLKNKIILFIPEIKKVSFVFKRIGLKNSDKKHSDYTLALPEDCSVKIVDRCEYIEKIFKKIVSQKEFPKYINFEQFEVKPDRIVIILNSQFEFFNLKRKKLDILLETKLRQAIKDRTFKVEFRLLHPELKNRLTSEMEIELQKKFQLELRAPALDTSGSTKILKKQRPKAGAKILIGKRIDSSTAVPINKISKEHLNRKIVVCGKVFKSELKPIKSSTCKFVILMSVTDETDSIFVKGFLKKVPSLLKTEDIVGKSLLIRGDVRFDEFIKEEMIVASDINFYEPEEQLHLIEPDRVEFHVHSKMSALDGLISIEELFAEANKRKMPAIAITDHGVVQAYPEVYKFAQKYGVKPIYGMEGYIINDEISIFNNTANISGNIKNIEFVVFDLETTGKSPRFFEIIEIGAVKVKKGKVLDTFHELIKPELPISPEIMELTGINPEELTQARTAKEVLKEFYSFIGDSVLVAHNAEFDYRFLKFHLYKVHNVILSNSYLDTLMFARALFPKYKSFSLKKLCKQHGVSLTQHHRALADARALYQLFTLFLKISGVQKIEDINFLCKKIDISRLRPYHILLIVKQQSGENPGLSNLYKLVTTSHVDYFYHVPKIPLSRLKSLRKGLLIGSACSAGWLIKSYLTSALNQELYDVIKFYDFIEVQPLKNYLHLIRDGWVKDVSDIKKTLSDIISLANKFNIPVIATSDAHVLSKNDDILRKILLVAQDYEDALSSENFPLLNGKELLEELKEYVNEKEANRIVYRNTTELADSIDGNILPVPMNLYPPEIEGAKERLETYAKNSLKEIYGDNVPDSIKQRFNRELEAIIGNGYAVLYLIAMNLVKKSNKDGYLVGSRGSVGSSFIAWLIGITEVNPLPPHYVCPECKNFIDANLIAKCEADLPDKICSLCRIPMNKFGFDIPFEVFMGFEGDKIPDIDLNFSGEYQSKIHKYVEKLFGKQNVFRAGTISCLAEKTVFGFINKYVEFTNKNLRRAEIERLAQKLKGVKRTTGQHPGGLMVLPEKMNIHSITPIQYPANSQKAGVFTTHFDYHAIHDTLVKLDLLGHDDPTTIKMLEELTGINAKDIPLNDRETMKIFSGLEPLGLKKEDIGYDVGTLGIPEFGTAFVRRMLQTTRPTSFNELIRISGLSHGTNVWNNNAEFLIKEGIATLNEVISVRDDIMNYLISKNMDKIEAFKIMESVRKGKGLTSSQVKFMKKHKVPDWYITSCNKISYMFPKAHAVAYVMMAFRIAYFKVHYKMAFYAAYFSIRADEFDIELALKSVEEIKRKIVELDNPSSSQKDKNLARILEVVLESKLRGIKFKNVDLELSDAVKFIPDKDALIPPFTSVQGLGENCAKAIVKARSESPFISICDLKQRGRVNKTIIEILKKYGVLSKLPETNQLTMF